MKRFIFGLSLFALVYSSCKEKEKVTIDKFTDTMVKDTIIKPSVADSLTADSLQNAFKAAANDTIIAGKSIGNIKLGAALSEVILLLGNPDSTSSDSTTLKWFSKPTGKGIDTALNTIMVYTAAATKTAAKKIKYIRVTSPHYKTPEKVSSGSTLTFIKMNFPAIKNNPLTYKDKNGTEVLIYDAVNDGIAFEINEATKCAGITVHEPGKKASETYISLNGEVAKSKKYR